MFRLLALLPALILAACGGGGATPYPSSSSGQQPVVNAAPPLNFTPAVVLGKQVEGQSSTMAVGATLARPADFPATAVVIMRVEGPEQVISQGSSVASTATGFTTTIATSPNLPEGRHTGNLTVKLCSDSECSRQYAGSPMTLPFQIDVSVRQLSVERNSNGIFTYRVNGAAIVPDQIRVLGPGRGWTVQSNAAWLKPSVASGNGVVLLTIVADPTGLMPASYRGVLTFRTADGQLTTLEYQLQVVAA